MGAAVRAAVHSHDLMNDVNNAGQHVWLQYSR